MAHHPQLCFLASVCFSPRWPFRTTRVEKPTSPPWRRFPRVCSHRLTLPHIEARSRSGFDATRSNSVEFLNLDHCASLVVTTMRAHAMGQLGLKAFRTQAGACRGQRVVSPPLVAPGSRDLSLWICHDLTPFSSTTQEGGPSSPRSASHLGSTSGSHWQLPS